MAATSSGLPKRTGRGHYPGTWVVPAALLMGLLLFPLPASTQPLPVVFVGAGDIADCRSSGDEATAALLDTIDGTVFTLGDNVYDSCTGREFARCYDPSWGRY